MSFVAELRRRNVFRVGAAYAVIAWFIIQAADIMLDNFGAPGWVFKTVVGLLVLGFPLALFLSWAYELTPEGMRKTEEVTPDESVAPKTGRRIDRLIVAALLGVIVILIAERVWFLPSSAPLPDAAGETTSAAVTESIAVLAFENMSPDADNAFFADGIAEEILNLLADVQALSVASRTSAFAFKSTKLSVPEIASQLNVRYVLEGSVRKAGDQVRVTAQLIDAETDRHLWSETFDRTLDDIFAIQDEIAGAIGEALQVELLGDGGQEIQAEQIDPETYARFLEARHKLRQRTRDAMREANEMLIEIVEAEPGFARAHVVLGEAYLLNRNSYSGLPLVPDSVAVSQARLHAAMARELNPRLSGIDLILGSIAGDIQNDQVAALEHYSRAIELEPNEPRPYHWRGMLLCEAGFLVRGLADISRVLTLDPDNPNGRLAAASCLLSGNNPLAARALAREGVELGNPIGTGLIAIAELALGHRQAAVEIIQDILRSGFDPDKAQSHRDILRQLAANTSMEPEPGQAEPREESDSDIGMLLAIGGYDSFFEKLAKQDSLPLLAGHWSNQHAEMRRDPRFIEVMTRFGFVDLWKNLGPPPDCRADGESFTCGHGHEPLKFNPQKFHP